MRLLKPLFPLARFAEDVKQRGRRSAVADRAGVARSQVCGWLTPNGPAARAKQLEQVLAANDIDPGPYQAYLATARPTVSAVCPACGEIRDVQRGDLVDAANRKRSVLPPPRALPDGRVEWLCKDCTRKRLQKLGQLKTDFTDFNETMLSAFVPEEDQWVFETDKEDPRLAAAERKYPDPKRRRKVRRQILRRAWFTVLNTHGAKRKAASLNDLASAHKQRELKLLEAAAEKNARGKYEKISQKASAAKSEETKRKMSHSAFRCRGRLRGRLHLCPLDGLFVYKPRRYGRTGTLEPQVDTRWHKQCHVRWMIFIREWSRSHPGLVAPSLPPPTCKPGGRTGRPAGLRNGARFMRDFEIVRAYYDPESSATLTDLAKLMTRAPGLGKYRSRRGPASKNAVLKVTDRFLARQGGHWNVTFSTGGYVTRHPQGRSHERSFSGTNERRNHELQKLVPLPEALQSHVASGARDRIIARLHFFRMPVREVVELTGAPEERVQGVIESPLALEVAAELSSWLERKAGPAAVIERRDTRKRIEARRESVLKP
jgi:hypothetical protein